MILTSPLKSSWNWYQLNDLWRLHIFWLKTCETKTKCSTMDFTTQSPSSVDLSILLESGIWQKVWKIWKNFWNLADYQTNFFQTIFDPSLTKILCQKYISRRDSFVGLRVPNNCIILEQHLLNIWLFDYLGKKLNIFVQVRLSDLKETNEPILRERQKGPDYANPKTSTRLTKG